MINVLILISSGLMQVKNENVFLAGRVMFGIAAGSLTVLIPKFIEEIAPLAIKG